MVILRVLSIKSLAAVHEVRKDDPVSSRVLRLARTAGHPSEMATLRDQQEATAGQARRRWNSAAPPSPPGTAFTRCLTTYW